VHQSGYLAGLPDPGLALTEGLPHPGMPVLEVQGVADQCLGGDEPGGVSDGLCKSSCG
jgi:hypothetical protein